VPNTKNIDIVVSERQRRRVQKTLWPNGCRVFFSVTVGRGKRKLLVLFVLGREGW